MRIRQTDLALMLTALAIGAAPSVGAQSDTAVVTAWTTLRVPNGQPLICKLTAVRPLQVNEGGWITVHITVGATDTPGAVQREIEVDYDTLHRPRSLIDYRLDSAEARAPTIETVLVWFDTARSRVAGFHRVESMDSVSGLRVPTLAGFPPLPPGDAERARALAEWVWTHRCYQGPPIPKTAPPR